jgi:hypothetical protein
MRQRSFCRLRVHCPSAIAALTRRPAGAATRPGRQIDACAPAQRGGCSSPPQTLAAALARHPRLGHAAGDAQLRAPGSENEHGGRHSRGSVAATATPGVLARLARRARPTPRAARARPGERPSHGSCFREALPAQGTSRRAQEAGPGGRARAGGGAVSLFGDSLTRAPQLPARAPTPGRSQRRVAVRNSSSSSRCVRCATAWRHPRLWRAPPRASAHHGGPFWPLRPLRRHQVALVALRQRGPAGPV